MSSNRNYTRVWTGRALAGRHLLQKHAHAILTLESHLAYVLRSSDFMINCKKDRSESARQMHLDKIVKGGERIFKSKFARKII